MKTAKHHICLMFDIQNQFIQKIGEVKILLQKETDIEKWKNPDLVKQEAIDSFKLQHPKYKDDKLNASYTSDFIPYI